MRATVQESRSSQAPDEKGLRGPHTTRNWRKLNPARSWDLLKSYGKCSRKLLTISLYPLLTADPFLYERGTAVSSCTLATPEVLFLSNHLNPNGADLEFGDLGDRIESRDGQFVHRDLGKVKGDENGAEIDGVPHGGSSLDSTPS